MHGLMLNCTHVIILLMAGLVAMSDGNQGKEKLGVKYTRGVDCRFISSSLKYVCAQGVGITEIPSPCCVSNVRYLELVGNPVTVLHKKEFSRRFSSLHGMDLRNNQISHIQHGAFAGLRRLQILDLSGNRLTSLSDGVFKGLSSLTTLHLGGNGMVSMSQEAFRGLHSLSLLRLENNNLQEIQEEAFEPLERLLSLYLDGNQISQLDSESFSGLRRLQTLSLASNQLQTTPDILRKLPELVELVLSSNPLICDCRLVFLQDWLAGHNSGQSRDTVRCSSPPLFRGYKLRSISPRLLCQTVYHQPNTNGGPTSYDSPVYDGSIFSPASVNDQEQGDSFQSVIIDVSAGVDTTLRQTTAPTFASARFDKVFFEDVSGSDHAAPAEPSTRPNWEPGIPMYPGHRPPKATTVPVVVTTPTYDSGRPGLDPPNHRPGTAPAIPNGRPTAANPNPAGQNPSGPRPPERPPPNEPPRPTSGYDGTNQDSNNVGNTGVEQGRYNSDQPTLSSGEPSINPSGSSHPNDTAHIPNVTSPDLSRNETDPPNIQPTDSASLTIPVVTYNTSMITELPDADGPGIDSGTDSNGSSSVQTPNAPLVVYGVEGQSVVLHCGTDDLDPHSRVRWLHPNGQPVTGLNSRFELKRDGSLRIHPLRISDTGSYRCIVRNMASSRVILVRLRTACPCADAASSDGRFYDELSPELFPVPPYSCSWTPLVIAVVTTFQGTVVACALVFCIWYTRCYRRKTFTIRVQEAEKRDSKRLRNSDMSVLRRCSNSTITSRNDSSRDISFEQGSFHPSDSLTTVSPRTSHTLSDYMNAYVTQQMRRQYHMRLPVPDYVDLDPNSRDPHETLYSSLRGRDFSNRRRRIVTQ